MPPIEFLGWAFLVVMILGAVGYVMYGYLQGRWSRRDPRTAKAVKEITAAEERELLLLVAREIQRTYGQQAQADRVTAETIRRRR